MLPTGLETVYLPAAQLGQVKKGKKEAVNVPPGQPLEESKQKVEPGALLKPGPQGRQEEMEVAAVTLL